MAGGEVELVQNTHRGWAPKKLKSRQYFESLATAKAALTEFIAAAALESSDQLICLFFNSHIDPNLCIRHEPDLNSSSLGRKMCCS